jgi:hypothetical protein
MTSTMVRATEIAELWRSDADGTANPAGPLYTSGRWARHDLVASNEEITRCSSCTASRTAYCC